MRTPRQAISVLSSIAITLVLSLSLSAQTQNTELKPYTDFLENQHISAKDYVLNLFKSKDIVILCERDHPDTTQYDLYLSIIGDKRFTAEVGNVFTEVGTSTLNPKINAFVHSDGLSQDSAVKAILEFHRNCSWAPIWEKENFSYLLRGIYLVNQHLKQDQKINLYPSDVPFDWTQIDTASYRRFWKTLEPGRDSVMASQIIRVFESIRALTSQRKKALVIMNYRHAFGHGFQHPSGKKANNVGRFLFEKYSDRVANVYVNFLAFSLRSPNNGSWGLIHNGKWDAAFKAVNKEDVGFDFRGSPFGEEAFDIWPFPNPFTFKDVFDGFVFYLPLEKHRCVVGIPGFIDSQSESEIMRRWTIFNTVLGRATDFTIEGLQQYCNEKRIFQFEGLDSLIAMRDKWLH